MKTPVFFSFEFLFLFLFFWYPAIGGCTSHRVRWWSLGWGKVANAQDSNPRRAIRWKMTPVTTGIIKGHSRIRISVVWWYKTFSHMYVSTDVKLHKISLYHLSLQNHLPFPQRCSIQIFHVETEPQRNHKELVSLKIIFIFHRRYSMQIYGNKMLTVSIFLWKQQPKIINKK